MGQSAEIFGFVSENGDDLPGFVDKLPGYLFGIVKAVQCDESDFPLSRVFVQGFADQFLLALNVKNVIGNLESDADFAGIVNQSLALLRRGFAEDGSGFAGIAD